MSDCPRREKYPYPCFAHLDILDKEVDFEVNEILHIAKYSPLNAYRGFGTVSGAALAIDTDTFAAEYQRNFLATQFSV